MKNRIFAKLCTFAAAGLLIFIWGCSITNPEAGSEIPSEHTAFLELYFCPADDCKGALIRAFDSAQESIHCAFYDLGHPGVIGFLDRKRREVELKIVVDHDYFYKSERLVNVKRDTNSGLMHHKFCIIDRSVVITGSANPTERGLHHNNNNILIIESYHLARNYEKEFEELWNLEFRQGDPAPYPYFYLNGNLVEILFCPEDNCEQRIIERIREAESSVYFMSFTFTSPSIANSLIIKHYNGLDVRGVVETRQSSGYSVFGLLEHQGIDVRRDSSPYSMHHKVFIIDNRTVITGSYNPTRAANYRNDENILILHDELIAQRFLFEFDWLFEASNLG